MSRSPRASASTTKAPVGERASDAIEAYLRAHPEKRFKSRGPAPLPLVLTESEKYRAAVLAALGHDEDGKCPAGVDWRALDADPRAFCCETPENMQTAIRAANMRAASVINFNFAHVKGKQPRTRESIPACGWWFCGQRLKANQWKDLAHAVKILTGAGIDPSGEGVAYKAGNYAEGEAWRKRWPDYKPLADDFEAFRRLTKALSLPQAAADELLREPAKAAVGTPAIHLLRGLALAKWAAHPKGVGKPVDAPYHRLLNEYPLGPSANWTPAVAASVLVLFGLVKQDSRLDAAIHRAEVTWDRGDELNAGRK